MDIYGSLMDIFDQPPARSAKTFMGIFDHSQCEAQIYLWEFMAH